MTFKNRKEAVDCLNASKAQFDGAFSSPTDLVASRYWLDTMMMALRAAESAPEIEDGGREQDADCWEAVWILDEELSEAEEASSSSSASAEEEAEIIRLLRKLEKLMGDEISFPGNFEEEITSIIFSLSREKAILAGVRKTPALDELWEAALWRFAGFEEVVGEALKDLPSTPWWSRADFSALVDARFGEEYPTKEGVPYLLELKLQKAMHS